MSWKLPKLFPKLLPQKPSITFWVGLLLLALTLSTALIYFLHIKSKIHSNEDIIIIYSVVILLMFFLFGLRIFIFEIKLYFVQSYNKELDVIRDCWKRWSQRGLQIAYMYRVTPFSPNELIQLDKSEVITESQNFYSMSQSLQFDPEGTKSSDDTIHQLLKPFHKIEFEFLKYIPADVYFIVSDVDYERFVQKHEYQDLSSPVNEILVFFQKMNFQLLKSTVVPSTQLHSWLSKTIDNESAQHTFVFFLDNIPNYTETYSWWYIQPTGSPKKQFTSDINRLLLRRPLVVPRHKINYGLSSISKFQFRAKMLSEAWINGTLDEDIANQLAICGQALSYGFSNSSIFNANKIYGKTTIASVGALVGVLHERNSGCSLVANCMKDSVALFIIEPIK